MVDFIEEKTKLITALDQGFSGVDFSAAYTALLDSYLKDLYREALNGKEAPKGLALVALGGYGRSEVSPYSDVDLLFLYGSGLGEERVRPLVEAVLYPLWDQKLDVGHASRTVDECQSMGRSDFATLVSLIESRLLIGDEDLFLNFLRQLRYWLSSKTQRRSFFTNLKNNVEARYRKYGQSPYLLEPDVKNGQGGLRDIQAISWAGLGIYGISGFDELAEAGLLPKYGALALKEDRDFMVWVRAQLHRLADSKNETLTLMYQENLANRFGYEDEGDITAAEGFMHVYYTHVYSVSNNLDFLLSRVEEDLRPTSVKRITQHARTVEKGLLVRRGLVELVSSTDVRRRSVLMMRAFEVAMSEGLQLSHQTLDVIRSNIDLIDDNFRRNPEAAQSFFRAISAIPSNTPARPRNIEAMQEINFLAAYIPELAPVKARAQHDAYHLYTVDVHLVLTLWELKKIASKQGEEDRDDFELSILEQVKKPEVLYLAALVHDIGKGLGHDHARRGAELVPQIGERLGLSPDEIEALVFLVAEHLFLIETATRRDLTEEKLILTSAQRVGDIDRLNMLYLLTVADSRATGPTAWSQWKASLLRDLYTKVYHVLTRSDLAGKEAANRREKLKIEVKKILKNKLDPERVEFGLENVSAHYLSVMNANQIARHLLLEDRFGDGVMVWEVRDTNKGFYEVTLVTKDRPGLLASMAGVFSLNSINILGAQVFTRANGIAIDIFHVDSPPDPIFIEEAWAKVKEDARKVLIGEMTPDFRSSHRRPVFKVTQKVPHRPSRVEVDNEVSDFYTVIEVFAHDRLGLLYDLTQTIFNQNLTIHIARISTKVDQVVDVFYVRDFDGQKLDEKDIQALKEALALTLEE
ncbi:MAG: [protein-PII] uridylyltransferase [Deltaproteobacteria bacterium]|nr:[protein-PII] uridylyltransferase [Deltaproteobacteria bacterium]MBW2050789.1 [protein-PII] uridylyltransferase [Deltaproteobacteria bacterium]